MVIIKSLVRHTLKKRDTAIRDLFVRPAVSVLSCLVLSCLVSSSLVFSGPVLSSLLFSCLAVDFLMILKPVGVHCGSKSGPWPGTPQSRKRHNRGLLRFTNFGRLWQRKCAFYTVTCNFRKNDAKATTIFAEDTYHENKRLVQVKSQF